MANTMSALWEDKMRSIKEQLAALLQFLKSELFRKIACWTILLVAFIAWVIYFAHKR